MSTRRALVVMVAGTSRRFRDSAERDVLKCLYHEGRVEDSLLYFAACYARIAGFDIIRFVGGYQYDRLTAAVSSQALRDQTSGRDVGCVFNPEFEAKGTAQTVYLGLCDVLQSRAADDLDEIVLMEGDVVGDSETLEAVVREPHDVVTACREPITARESVALYKTARGKLRFAYDTHHRSLIIAEPFCEIYNSGQLWKFANISRLRRTIASLTNTDREGTCLVLLEKYFNGTVDPAVITFESWVNCNTLRDYHYARELLRDGISKWTH